MASSTWRGAAVSAAVARAGTRGLGVATEHLLGASNRRVPIEEGTLERSGTASVEDSEGAVSYDTVYAVRQHEELDWRHDEGRTAKYLESALNEEADTIRALIAGEIGKALR